MRRFPLFFGAVMVVAAFGVPGAAFAQAPARDSIVGSGSLYLTNFAISVEAGPNGENPTGSLTLSGFVNGKGTATCLSVSGNVAVAGFVAVEGPNTGQGFFTQIHDNGPPINGRAVDSTLYNGYLASGPLTTCPAPGAGPPPGLANLGGGVLDSGDMTIIDGTAPPKPRLFTKRECELGGWARMGFTSRRQCDNFVRWQCKNGRHAYYGFPTIYHCRQAIRS